MDFFREKQNELRLLEKELQKYRDRITQVNYLNLFSIIVLKTLKIFFKTVTIHSK